ncbi:hypothetical protein CRM22_002758 [Opisthorchis felineus]|uniref:EF-hand domain-containing protein n=1 Tax=Opisthorchis felineus TaxID=147828 RepID=A0A4S2M4I6_OPIFE|nr:hypothetical protein CRM22_002758 [Opisthorchis felineus]
MSRFLLLVCAFGLLVGLFAKPHSETRSREEVEHFADDPSRHDVNFDHAAFLGSETAKEYSKLTPEQSREKLKEIIRKIDKDADGKVTEKEMKEWIAYVAKVGQQQVTEKRWSEVNQQGLNPLPWEVYVEASYGKEEERWRQCVLGGIRQRHWLRLLRQLNNRRMHVGQSNHLLPPSGAHKGVKHSTKDVLQ